MIYNAIFNEVVSVMRNYSADMFYLIFCWFICTVNHGSEYQENCIFILKFIQLEKEVNANVYFTDYLNYH